MLAVDFEQSTVNDITETLDRLGMHRSADELVVVGGAAMAAFGIKRLRETDLDIAVTESLLDHLKHDDRWTEAVSEKKVGPSIKSRKAGTARIVGEDYCGVKTQPGDISAIRMPLNDGIYPVTTEELIKEGLPLGGGAYRYTKPQRILDWKLALLESNDRQVDKEKHLKDARRISHYLLTLALGE